MTKAELRNRWSQPNINKYRHEIYIQTLWKRSREIRPKRESKSIVYNRLVLSGMQSNWDERNCFIIQVKHLLYLSSKLLHYHLSRQVTVRPPINSSPPLSSSSIEITKRKRKIKWIFNLLAGREGESFLNLTCIRPESWL